MKTIVEKWKEIDKYVKCFEGTQKPNHFNGWFTSVDNFGRQFYYALDLNSASFFSLDIRK